MEPLGEGQQLGLPFFRSAAHRIAPSAVADEGAAVEMHSLGEGATAERFHIVGEESRAFIELLFAASTGIVEAKESHLSEKADGVATVNARESEAFGVKARLVLKQESHGKLL
jgi:hypothetical protein